MTSNWKNWVCTMNKDRKQHFTFSWSICIHSYMSIVIGFSNNILIIAILSVSWAMYRISNREVPNWFPPLLSTVHCCHVEPLCWRACLCVTGLSLCLTGLSLCVTGLSPGVFQVVEQGMFVKHSKVEVYLTELKLCEDGNMEKVVTRPFSKADRIGESWFLPYYCPPPTRCTPLARVYTWAPCTVVMVAGVTPGWICHRADFIHSDLAIRYSLSIYGYL